MEYGVVGLAGLVGAAVITWMLKRRRKGSRAARPDDTAPPPAQTTETVAIRENPATVRTAAGEVPGYVMLAQGGVGGWLTVSGRSFLTGPHPTEEIARRFLDAQPEVERELGIHAPNGFRPGRLVRRSDLSSIPFVVWELEVDGGSVFVVVGPSNRTAGWRGSEAAALLLASSLLAEFKQQRPASQNSADHIRGPHDRG